MYKSASGIPTLGDVLMQCDENFSGLRCCKLDGSECNCIKDLGRAFFEEELETYNCPKRASAYALFYGSAYASEIYHYLTASTFLQDVDRSRALNVISLGCGFSPDYFAIRKYFEDNGVDQKINYIGVDKSPFWGLARTNSPECIYYDHDITTPFFLSDGVALPDVVIISKVFSTLYSNNKQENKNLYGRFLTNLENFHRNFFHQNTKLVFVDINHWRKGRDVFHSNVIRYLKNCRQYYFAFDKSHDGDGGWVPIENNNLVFDVPERSSSVGISEIKKTIIFEYRK